MSLDLTPLFEERSVDPTVSFIRNQNSGHTLFSALLEPIDNELDSLATFVQVFLHKKDNGETCLVIAGDGVKALAPEEMHLMASEGWSTKNVSTESSPVLGKNGSGWKNFVSKYSKTGSSTVIMKREDDSIHAMEYNQSNMKAIGEWKVTIRKCHAKIKADDPALAFWKRFMCDAEGNYYTHGSIVIVHNLKPEAQAYLTRGLNFNPSAFNHSIGAQLGEVYQKRIDKGLSILVGKNVDFMEEVKALDPMLSRSPVQSKTFIIDGEEVIAKVFLVPERGECKGLPAEVYFRFVNNQNSGVYFYRDGRLHLDSKGRPMHPALGDKAINQYIEESANGSNGRRKKQVSRDERAWVAFGDSHGRSSRVRVSIETSSNLDKDFNVNQIKTEIDFTNDSVSELALWCYDMCHQYDQYRSKNKSYTYKDKWMSLTKGYRKDVLKVRQQVLNSLTDPEEIRVASTIISMFTENLGEVVE